MAETEPDQKQSVRTPSFSDYLRVFGYATRWDLFICIIASLASIGAGITLPLMNVIFGQLTGQFTQYSTMTRHDFQQLLDRQALYIMALFLGRWALNTINKFCFRVIAIHLSSAIRLDYLQSLLAQPVHVIDSMPPGAPAISITATTNTLLESITTIISAIIIAFIWSWSLALVTSSLMLYIMFVLAALLPLILKSQTATTKADAEGTAVASEALGGVRLVMACGAQDYILSRYQVCVTEALKRAQKMSPLVGSQVGLLVCSGIYVLDALM
jgi:ATP-binding cassette subfamily B (MDR/TAP) protein 1